MDFTQNFSNKQTQWTRRKSRLEPAIRGCAEACAERFSALKASHARGACVSLQSYSPFAPSLQTFPARARSRASTWICMHNLCDTKGKFRGWRIWKQNIQAKKVYSRYKLVTSFRGMGERSIFKSCHRLTIRNVRGIVMCARSLIPYRSCGYLVYTPSLMLSRFLLVLKMSVLDTRDKLSRS